jgi:rhomboid family GlyGly-CTERM serine protease
MRALRVPLLLIVLPAVLMAFAAARHGQLVLDRPALAAGQLWRLWSGHWIHFSLSHLFWNLTVLVLAGSWLESVRPGLLARHILLAAPCISLAILACEPGLQVYGGLSGLATGVVVLLALHQFTAAEALRWPWIGVLAVVFLKALVDLQQTTPLLATFTAPAVRTSTTAHAAGAICALSHHAGLRFQRLKMKPPGPVTGSRR